MLIKLPLAAALCLAAIPALALDYYVVVPVKNRVAPATVELRASTLPPANVGRAYVGFDFNRTLQVNNDPGFTGAGVSWNITAGNVPAGMQVGADGVLTGTPSAAGNPVFTLTARYKTVVANQSYSMQVAPENKVVQQAGGYRTWADGTAAASCASYLKPAPGYSYSGATGDGVYRVSINGTLANVYCDMVTDGGGWMLVLMAPDGLNKAYGSTNGQIAVRGLPLKSVSSNPTFPALPNGLANTFNQVLFKGGTAAWQQKMGGWVRFATFASEAELAKTLRGVATATGRTELYIDGGGFTESAAPANGVAGTFALWDTAGISPLCGGVNTPGGPDCPYFAPASGYPYHYDGVSARELYVR